MEWFAGRMLETPLRDAASSIEFSVVGESLGQHSVRISNIVGVGEVEYLPESVPVAQTPSTIYSAKSPAKKKRKRSGTPAPVVIKRRFEFDDESLVLPMDRVV